MALASSARDTVRSETISPARSRLRTTRPRSDLTYTSSGTTRGWPAFSTVGRSITAGVISGAVTMKMTSSTSITSTYGTMLISCIGPRRRSAGISSSHRLAVEDVRELLHEALEAIAEALDVVRVAVIGHHRRDGGEQADGGRDQRLRDARRDLRERRLLYVREVAEGMHDSPHRAEEADVRAHRAGGGEEGEMALEEIHLALEGRAHRAPRAVDHVAYVGARLAHLGELAIARLEHALERADGVAVVHRALVERVQVLAAPELALEFQRLRHGAAQDVPLLEDEHPGHERHGEQHHHHHLHHDARVKDQRPDVQIMRDGRHSVQCLFEFGWHASRLHAAFVHHGEDDLRFDQQLAGVFHDLAKHDARAADFNHFRADRNELVKPGGAVILDFEARHHELHAALFRQAREVDARLVEELGARALHEREVLRVVHHSARVGVLVVDADR